MPENKDGPASGWEKVKILSTLVATIIIPLVIAFVSQSYTKALKDNEIGVQYVELAVSILRESPDETSTNLRKWAIDIVNNYAVVPMSDQAIRELEMRSWNSLSLKNLEIMKSTPVSPSMDVIRDLKD